MGFSKNNWRWHNNFITSTITLYEIKVYLTRQKIPKTIINNILKRIDETSIIIPAEKSICILASENALKFNLHATDALIYTTSRDINSIFVTADKHFSKTPKTLLI